LEEAAIGRCVRGGIFREALKLVLNFYRSVFVTLKAEIKSLSRQFRSSMKTAAGADFFQSQQ
jgi:hypothetical protein